MPVSFGVDKILTGEVTAVLAPATTHDCYRQTADDAWHALDELQPGESVHEVYHWMQSEGNSTPGKVMIIHEIGDRMITVRVMITEIHLVHADELTEEEKDRLGRFDDITKRIGVNLIKEMGHRRARFLRIMNVADTPM